MPIAGQHPPKRADARNRVRILATARELLATRTPCDVSIDEIASAAGVGKGTIYRRFDDRGRLMQALLDEREAALQAAVLRATRRSGRAPRRSSDSGVPVRLVDLASHT
jgi:AcrR family transcriptional regulator